VRNHDAYTPGGRIGARPDLPTLVYTARLRQAFPGVPIVLGGIEASLRRFAHYDFWSDRIRGPLLLDAKADLLVYGMAEAPLREVVAALREGKTLAGIRHVPGTAYALGASEVPDGFPAHGYELPPLEEVRENHASFSRMTRTIFQNLNPFCASPLIQRAGGRAVVVNPPAQPLATADLDAIYEAPFTRLAHPSYAEPVPALETVRDSVVICRGCFGGCAFCSLSLHQGAVVQSRSPASVALELDRLSARPDWKGVVSDLGGPTANMYAMGCGDPQRHATCRRVSCLFPSICRHLRTDATELRELLARVREHPGVRKAFVNSGVRMDLALLSPEYIEDLAAHHVGGLLSVAPEHTQPDVLRVMGKPSWDVFLKFSRAFDAASRKAGKRQHLSLYLIAGHPGCDESLARAMALDLRRADLRPRQVQEFIPLPMTRGASMYWTGLDPFTLEPVHVSRRLSDTRRQKNLAMWWERRPKKSEGG